MSNNRVKELIEDKMKVLIGERVRQFRRAALMFGVDFGEDVEYKHMAGPRRGKVSIFPKFALHIHSSWRLLKEGKIYLGQNDLFNHMDGNFKLYIDDEESNHDVEFVRITEKLNELFELESVVVTRIEANELGDLRVYMEKDYRLELFVDSNENNESWRFFRNDDDSEYLVVFEEDEI